MLKRIKTHHKQFWSKDNAQSFMTGLLLFVFSIITQGFASRYVLNLKGVAVEDLLLDNLPRADIDFFIVEGALILTFVVLFLIIAKPRYLNFALKSYSIFILVRAFFITLTHLGPSPYQLVLDQNGYGFWLYDILYYTTNDFFFSGHTGTPFLMALIFWREKIWRYIFLATSFVFGVSVLLARIHYSIDVFAAPFITYSIFSLARYFFYYDYKISLE